MMVGIGLYMDDVHSLQPVDISSEIPSFSENTTGRKHLTFEIIRIIILLRLSRERDEAPIVTDALGSSPVGPCLKTSLALK
ncbi:hypothetical protein TNCV_4676691 [Trichonephila clavipes]|nr:hypothetical protein TNCV_4676691 [Trichonephila clavipes]